MNEFAASVAHLDRTAQFPHANLARCARAVGIPMKALPLNANHLPIRCKRALV